MKQRWYHFKLLCKEITEYSPKMWLWLIANIVVTVLLPLAQLLLSAQVISWLMNGMAITEYLTRLAIWMGVIVVLNGAEFFLQRYIGVEHEFFRINMMYRIMDQLSRHDYPLIISEEGQKSFAESLSLTGHTNTLFGRFLREFNGLMSAIISFTLYLYLIFQVDHFFYLLLPF